MASRIIDVGEDANPANSVPVLITESETSTRTDSSVTAGAVTADIIVTMDSDGQHDPAEIEALVKCLLEGPFDVVIGSRILDRDGMPISRVGANLLLNGLTFIAYGKIVSDSQSGFKAFTRDALQ